MLYEDDGSEEEIELPGDISVFENFLDDLTKGSDSDDSSNPEPPSDSDPDADPPF